VKARLAAMAHIQHCDGHLVMIARVFLRQWYARCMRAGLTYSVHPQERRAGGRNINKKAGRCRRVTKEAIEDFRTGKARKTGSE